MLCLIMFQLFSSIAATLSDHKFRAAPPQLASALALYHVHSSGSGCRNGYGKDVFAFVSPTSVDPSTCSLGKTYPIRSIFCPLAMAIVVAASLHVYLLPILSSRHRTVTSPKFLRCDSMSGFGLLKHCLVIPFQPVAAPQIHSEC